MYQNWSNILILFKKKMIKESTFCTDPSWRYRDKKKNPVLLHECVHNVFTSAQLHFLTALNLEAEVSCIFINLGAVDLMATWMLGSGTSRRIVYHGESRVFSLGAQSKHNTS